jgi:hypothetical protein
MIALTAQRYALNACLKRSHYLIRLRIASAAREDAWEMCQLAHRLGGVEVRECCFAFADEEQWVTALESLRFRFGPEYFEPVDAAPSNDGGASCTVDSEVSHGRSKASRA